MTIIDLPFVHVASGLLSTNPTLSQLYSGRLPRLERYQQLGVVAGHRGDGGRPGDVGSPGDCRGGCTLVDGRGGSTLVGDLSRGRGAAAQATNRR